MKKALFPAVLICVLVALAVLYLTMPIYSSPQKPVSSYAQMCKELADDGDITLPRESTLTEEAELLVLLNGRSRTADAVGYSISGTTEQDGIRRLYTRTCSSEEEISGGDPARHHAGTDIYARVTDMTISDGVASVTLWNWFTVGDHTYRLSETYSVSSAEAEILNEQLVECKANELLSAAYQLIDDQTNK